MSIEEEKKYLQDIEAEQRAMFSLTLRDYFAAKAMQGLCVEAAKMSIDDIEHAIPSAANIAYAIADAMLKERAQ